MADFAAMIETLEHRLQRAWMAGEERELKPLIARDFTMLVVGTKTMVLDKLSFIEAAGDGFVLNGYRVSDIHERRHGHTVVFTARFELDMRLGTEAWAGDFWITDLWRKSRINRKWRLSERMLSRPDNSERLPNHIRALQLWR